MLRSLLVGGVSLFLAAVMPVLVLEPMEVHQADDRLLIIETAESEKSSCADLKILTEGQIRSIPLEEYLVGVLISEMPLSFHPEALKAQTVAARTFAVKQLSGGKHDNFDVCDQSSCCQAWNSMDKLQEKLGDTFVSCLRKAEQAVYDTKGETIQYDGSCIDAVYFSCSGGMTEDAVVVWGTDVPYLKSVDSPNEEKADKFNSVVKISPRDFMEQMGRKDLEGGAEAWFGDTVRSEAGSVIRIKIGEKYHSGEELREKLHLNSTNFTVDTTGDQILFHVRGYGHRVGMSQYGANAMALNGATYREIIYHYYRGVEIQ